MKQFNLEIIQDNDPDNSRNCDNLTTMVCFHKRYDLGDKHNYKPTDFNSYEELKEEIEEDNKVLIIKPLYLYDHSGITISTSPFGCHWDSGQVGWVFVSKKQADYMGIPTDDLTKLEEYLEEDVKTYRQYVEGAVYGYHLSETIPVRKIYPNGDEVIGYERNELDSCWGFYGSNWSENGLLDAVIEYADNDEEKEALTKLVGETTIIY